MTQLFTDMSDSPAFTEQWNPSAGVVTIETSSLPSGSGTHALKIVKSAASRYVASWNAPGTPTGDVEALIKWQSNVLAAGSAQIMLHGSGSAGSENAYLAVPPTSGNLATMQRARYLSGASSTLAPSQTGISPPTATNTWLWTRLQRTGTTFQQRTWVDGNSEPGTWDSTSTDSNLSGGWVGVGSALNSVTIWVAQIGVGTGGDPAPDAPIITGIPAHLMRTQHYGPRGLTGNGGPFNG